MIRNEKVMNFLFDEAEKVERRSPVPSGAPPAETAPRLASNRFSEADQ
jgi:hypothetical protein